MSQHIYLSIQKVPTIAQEPWVYVWNHSGVQGSKGLNAPKATCRKVNLDSITTPLCPTFHNGELSRLSCYYIIDSTRIRHVVSVTNKSQFKHFILNT